MMGTVADVVCAHMKKIAARQYSGKVCDKEAFQKAFENRLSLRLDRHGYNKQVRRLQRFVKECTAYGRGVGRHHVQIALVLAGRVLCR